MAMLYYLVAFFADREASALAAAGVSDCIIMNMGWCRSLAFFTYVRMHVCLKPRRERGQVTICWPSTRSDSCTLVVVPKLVNYRILADIQECFCYFGKYAFAGSRAKEEKAKTKQRFSWNVSYEYLELKKIPLRMHWIQKRIWVRDYFADAWCDASVSVSKSYWCW